MGHVPFPSIEKFANMRQQLPFVFGSAAPAELTFTGTVKLHGTHADLCVLGEPVPSLHVQSRNRVLTLESDNDGCARWFHEREPHVREMLGRVGAALGAREFVLAGEFCGRGIQSKVALCGLPRMFVAFAARALGADGGAWAPLAAIAAVCDGLEEHGLYCIARFPTYSLQLDLRAAAEPEAAEAAEAAEASGAAEASEASGASEAAEAALRRADELTDAVDRECPFARQLGVIGAGEGIVWTCDQRPGNARLWFKTKGRAHAAPRQPRQPRQAAEAAESIGALAADLVTERRLEQGLEYLREMGISTDAPASTGAFARWVTDDACREEREEIAAEVPGEGMAVLRKSISRLAASWFKARC